MNGQNGGLKNDKYDFDSGRELEKQKQLKNGKNTVSWLDSEESSMYPE